MRWPLLAALSLVGCGSQVTPSIAPPLTADVAMRAGELYATGLHPAEYFSVGSLIVGERCHAFFRTLGDRAAQIDFASSEVGLAQGAAAGIGAATGLGQAGLAMTAIAGALAQGTLNNAKNLPVPYPVATAHLVDKSMAAYLADAPEPRNVAEAAMLVDAEAWLCSVPGATWLSQQAVAAANPYTTTPSSSAGAASPWQRNFESAYQRHMVPPTVEIR